MIPIRMTTPLASAPIEFQSATGLISMTDIPPSIRRMPDHVFLVQLEIHREVVEDVDGLAIQRPRPELPLPDCFDRSLVETERQRLEDVNVDDVAVLVDRALHDDDAGDARLAGHFRIDGIGAADLDRRLDVAADAQRSSGRRRRGVRDHAADDTADDAADDTTFD